MARLPVPRQLRERVGLEQRLVELAPLEVVQLGERRVAEDFPDAAAKFCSPIAEPRSNSSEASCFSRRAALDADVLPHTERGAGPR
jgi:hypothetical protein